VEPSVIDSDGTQPPRRSGVLSRLRRMHPSAFVRRHHFRITLFFLGVSFFLLLFWHTVIVAIPAGHEGVYWRRFFGGTSNRLLTEGSHLKFPWDEIYIYDVRLMTHKDTTYVLTTDGLTVTVDYVAQYRAEMSRLPELHRLVGEDYANKVVIPVVVSSLRQILGNYRAEEIYARDELSLLGEIRDRIRDRIETYPIHFEAVLLLRVDLPKAMAEGIVDKLLQEQRVLAYTYRLRAEEQESKRKETEAQGIAAFEKISGISMLKWRGLDVTSELAKSPNAKTIVIGTGPNGLPLILNSDK